MRLVVVVVQGDFMIYATLALILQIILKRK